MPARESGRQMLLDPWRCRPLRGLKFLEHAHLGFRSAKPRFTLGYMLPRALRVEREPYMLTPASQTNRLKVSVLTLEPLH